MASPNQNHLIFQDGIGGENAAESLGAYALASPRKAALALLAQLVEPPLVSDAAVGKKKKKKAGGSGAAHEVPPISRARALSE